LPISISSEVAPIWREYERASTTIADAYLRPLFHRYVASLDGALRDSGMTREWTLMKSNGGAMLSGAAADAPIQTVMSGPAGGMTATEHIARALGEVNVVTLDMGGTSADVGILVGGAQRHTTEYEIEWGLPAAVPVIDIKSIGAGGGSIVWIDPGGLLRVGPQSAGAEPGPACYGHGGSEATITDAAVVLGWIDPDYFLGGRLPLEADAAHAAVERALAGPLGLGVHEAAHAALTISSENIVGAIREITIAQGIDPREVTLVAGGGASGLNIVPIARELGCRRVLLPSTASALSACGALFADIVSEFSRSRYEETRSLDREAVNEALAEVESRADAFLTGLRGLPVTETRRHFFVEARYRAQVWELDVPVPSRLESDEDVRAVEEAFHATHERIFAVREPGQYLECLLWKARATAVLEKPDLQPREPSAAGADAPDHVEAYFKETGLAPVPRYDGAALPAGTKIHGPAILREPTTTVVVYPGSSAVVTELGNYLLELESDAADGRPVREKAIA
jgi:N-methylhydantoinase A